MKLARALAPILTTLALSIGCSDAGVGQQEDLATESDIITTYNGDLALLGSYNELFDKGSDTPCVAYADGGEHARVSEPSRDLSIELVQKKEDLAQKLGIDLNLKARYAAVGGNATVNLLHEYSSSSHSLSYLLSARADYLVRDDVKNGRPIVLTEVGEQALAAGPSEFARRCGTHYINAVRYGARFYLLITYTANDYSSKTTMDASLGVDGGPAGSGDIKTRLERTANLSGVSVSIKGASNGFWLDEKPATEVVKQLSTMKVDANLFGAATQLYFEMTKAVEREYCLDSGQGSCGGTPSPGYFARTTRDGAVTGVQLGAYHSLDNANWSGDNPFAIIKDRVEAAKRYIRQYSEIEVRMDNIYADEIRPFMQAPPQYKPMFNIAPPGKAKRTPDEVYAVAKGIDELIYPPTGGVMGWLREDIRDRIIACLDKVNVDIMASCTANDTMLGPGPRDHELDPDETVEWTELYAFFDDYHDNKRILPVQVAYGTSAVTYKYAQQHCDALAKKLNAKLAEHGSSQQVVYRLARGNEVFALGPVLSHGNVQWTKADKPHATWYTDIDGRCGADYPYYRNAPAESTAFWGCSADDWWDDDFIPLCVPASGPMPLMPPQ